MIQYESDQKHFLKKKRKSAKKKRRKHLLNGIFLQGIEVVKLYALIITPRFSKIANSFSLSQTEKHKLK